MNCEPPVADSERPDILRQMRTNDPIIEQAGNVIDRQVGQMVRLVDDLLDISRITQGKLRIGLDGSPGN